MDVLLTRSMRVVLESVGARRGILFLARRGELRTAVIGEEGAEVSLPRDGVLEHAPFGSLDIVRRVFRSGQAETHDRIVRGGVERSGLCVPVVWQRRSLGVLYVESDVVSAFGRDRSRVLEVLAAQLAISVRNAMREEAQSRFVPVEFLRSLEREDIVDVEVGDHRIKEVSVLFSDIWGFTTLVEKLPVEEALAFVNRYLFFAEPPITGGGGFIDSYQGDGIMALFDAPELNPRRAVAAGVALHQALDRFNGERRRLGQGEVRTGVGINTGVVTLATIGGQRSLQCGVVGDAVNLASRIEGLTRHYAVRLLVSDVTRGRLGDDPGFTMRRAGRARVKGREQPLTVYEVLDAEPADVVASRVQTVPLYEGALTALWERDLVRAEAGWRDCLARDPGDRQSQRYLAVVAELKEKGFPDGWDGVEGA